MPLSTELADGGAGGCWPTRAPRHPEPEMQHAPAARVAGAWSALPSAGRCWSRRCEPRGPPPVRASRSRAPCHEGLGRSPPRAGARSPRTSPSRRTNTASSCSGPGAAGRRGRAARACSIPPGWSRTSLASINVSELARRQFRDRAHRRAGVRGPAAARQEHARAAGEHFAGLRGAAPVRRRQPAAGPGRARSARVAAGVRAAAGGAGADGLFDAAAARDCAPDKLAFPLMVARIRETFSNEKVADRVARMLAELEAAADATADPRAPRARRKPR